MDAAGGLLFVAGWLPRPPSPSPGTPAPGPPPPASEQPRVMAKGGHRSGRTRRGVRGWVSVRSGSTSPRGPVPGGSRRSGLQPAPAGAGAGRVPRTHWGRRPSALWLPWAFPSWRAGGHSGQCSGGQHWDNRGPHAHGGPAPESRPRVPGGQVRAPHAASPHRVRKLAESTRPAWPVVGRSDSRASAARVQTSAEPPPVRHGGEVAGGKCHSHPSGGWQSACTPPPGRGGHQARRADAEAAWARSHGATGTEPRGHGHGWCSRSKVWVPQQSL